MRLATFALAALLAACGVDQSLFGEGADRGKGGSAGKGGSGGKAGEGGTPSGGGSGGAAGRGGDGGEAMAGRGGQGGSEPALECVLEDFCSEADPVACVCMGCKPGNPECTQNEDCVCSDCDGRQGCTGCERDAADGVCNPYFEGCDCDDCSQHPECS